MISNRIRTPVVHLEAGGDAGIAEQLKTVYATAALNSYLPLFYMYFTDSHDFDVNAGQAIHHGPTDFLFRKYTHYQPTVRMYVRAFEKLAHDLPNIFTGTDTDYQVFVALDKFADGHPAAVLVPYQTARLLSACFMKGLVTRLILEKYNGAWKDVPFNLNLPLNPAPPPNGSKPNLPVLSADGWAQARLTALAEQFSNSANWVGANYTIALQNLTDSSVQVAGMILGWRAGDQLKTAGVDPNGVCEQAIWTLLATRFSTEQIGTMVGYAFCYLAGYLESERTNAIIQNDPHDPPTPARYPQEVNSATAPGHILNHVSDHLRKKRGDADDPIFNIANNLFQFLMDELAMLPTNTKYKHDPILLQKAATSYKSFIDGFEFGLTIGADVMFATIYREALEVGYTNGLMVGYTQGYSAGWQAGYGVGLQAGQSTWMNGLENTIGQIAGIVGDANDVFKIINYADTVGTVIAGLLL